MGGERRSPFGVPVDESDDALRDKLSLPVNLRQVLPPCLGCWPNCWLSPCNPPAGCSNALLPSEGEPGPLEVTEAWPYSECAGEDGSESALMSSCTLAIALAE